MPTPLLAFLAAAAVSSAPDACIDTLAQPNWQVVDDHTLRVRSGVRAFRVTTETCPGLADPLPQITTVLPGGSRICTPHDARLFVSRGGLIPTPCFIQSIAPLTAEQDEALSKAAANRK